MWSGLRILLTQYHFIRAFSVTAPTLWNMFIGFVIKLPFHLNVPFNSISIINIFHFYTSWNFKHTGLDIFIELSRTSCSVMTFEFVWAVKFSVLFVVPALAGVRRDEGSLYSGPSPARAEGKPGDDTCIPPLNPGLSAVDSQLPYLPRMCLNLSYVPVCLTMTVVRFLLWFIFRCCCNY